MNEIYDKEEYYKKYKSYFIKIIKDFKKANPTKEYKELKPIKYLYQIQYASSLSHEKINNYKFSEIEFIFFKIYYIFKNSYYFSYENSYYSSYENIFINLFKFFTVQMKPEYIKYIKIFYIIIKKYYPFKLIIIFKNVFNIVNYNLYNYELYLEYLENLFFNNFFFIEDINTYIIDNIKNNLFVFIKDNDIIIKYVQPLDNILSWSIIREIWICLCIFAKPKIYNK